MSSPAWLRRHRSALTFVGVVLLLAGLLAAALYGADRWAQNGIERQVAKNLQSALATPGEPQVSVDGFPFLTQVATRNVRQVHVVADDVGTTGGNALSLAHVDLLASDVMTTDWFQTMTASHIEGNGLIAYAALQGVANVPLSYAGEGRIRMETTATLFGAKVVAQITGSPRLERGEQTMTLADPTIKVAGVESARLYGDGAASDRGQTHSAEGSAAPTGRYIGRGRTRRPAGRRGCRRGAVSSLTSAQVGVQPNLLQSYSALVIADLPPTAVRCPAGIDEERSASVICGGDPAKRPAKAVRPQRVDGGVEQP